MKKYYIETYGCQMNVYDSELVAGILNGEGYEATAYPEEADLLLINTCSVREHAEDKVHSRLGEFSHFKQKNPDVLIGVIGCMAQNLKKKLIQKKPYVNFIIGPDGYRHLPLILEEAPRKKHIVDTKLSRFEVYDELFPARNEGINAWISIMRGCDKFCSYCIVPYTRGRERSRSLESVVNEARQVIAQGFREITLLGQNVNSYRHEKHRFPDLLKAVAEVDGVTRLRYTSPHPQDADQALFDVHRDYYPVVCNHIHLPVQSGADAVLQAMNRSYSRDHYLRLVEQIRESIPDVAISTDMIVGFPGEKVQDFEDTLNLMEKVRFDAAFMFKYSERPGTKAALLADDVSEEEKDRRLQAMIALQREHTLAQNQRHIGKEESILVEGFSRKTKAEMMGRTTHNKIVIFPAKDYQPKQLIHRSISDARGVTLFAMED